MIINTMKRVLAVTKARKSALPLDDIIVLQAELSGNAIAIVQQLRLGNTEAQEQT